LRRAIVDHRGRVDLFYTRHTMKPAHSTVIVGLCLPLLACYEEPVRDHLHIVFTPGPAIVVTAVRDIAPPAENGKNTAVAERTDEARADLATGLDRWSRSFSDLGAIADRSTIVRHDGEVRQGIHSALLDSFDPVERLLGDEGLGAFFREAGGVRELELYPTGGGWATRQQRELVDAEIGAWSAQVADYLEAAVALYAYLDRAPGRAVPCFAHVFDIDTEAAGPVDDREAEMIRSIKGPMERVADILLIEDDQAYSLNELSRLVFDTFQGRLTIAVDGPVAETEGFIADDGVVERPPVDLWRSLETVVGRWLQPDLVTAMVRPGPDATQPEPDPAEFADLPRRWTPPPGPATIESEIRTRLRPEPLYRVRWQTPPVVGDEDEVLESALRLLATAELELPD